MKLYATFFKYNSGASYIGVHPSPELVIECINSHIDAVLEKSDFKKVPPLTVLRNLGCIANYCITFSDGTTCEIQILSSNYYFDLRDAVLDEDKQSKLSEFDHVHWSIEDIETKMKELGIKPSVKNLGKAMDMLNGKLSDSMVEAGWSAMETLLLSEFPIKKKGK